MRSDAAPAISTRLYLPSTLYTPWTTEVYQCKCLIPRVEHTWLDANHLVIDWNIFDCEVYFTIDDDMYEEVLGARTSI